jgi:uncharacterized membrane protein
MKPKVKILGVPLHPALAAFPIAFYTATFVAYLIFILNDQFRSTIDYRFIDIAIAANLAGIVMAAVAAIPGFVDRASIPGDSSAKRPSLIHLTLNIAAVLFFIVNNAIHTNDWDYNAHPHSLAGLILSGLGLACTVVAYYYGSAMTQESAAGVNR